MIAIIFNVHMLIRVKFVVVGVVGYANSSYITTDLSVCDNTGTIM